MWTSNAKIITKAKKKALAIEQERLSSKAECENKLASIVHIFSDGRVVQVRRSDFDNFKEAIKDGRATDWILADNSTSKLTLKELESALESGKAQAKKILKEYVEAVKALKPS